MRAAAGPESGSGLARRLWLLGRALVERFTVPRAGGPRLLSVAATLSLGPKKSLLVVVCGERRFLVATGGETIAAMLEIDPDRPRRAPGAVRRGRREFRPAAALRRTR